MNNSLSIAAGEGGAYQLVGEQLDQVSGGSAGLAVEPAYVTDPTDTSASLIRNYSGGRFTPVRSQPDSW